MTWEIPPLASFALVWLGIVNGTLFLFGFGEKELTSDFKSGLALQLKELRLRPLVIDIPRQFAAVFDSVYGREHFSMRCFLRSALTTVMSSVIVFLLWYFKQAGQFSSYASGTGLLKSGIVAGGLLILFNVVPDYISLLETRLVIAVMAKQRRLRMLAFLLISDIVFTFGIWLIFYAAINHIGVVSGASVYLSSMIPSVHGIFVPVSELALSIKGAVLMGSPGMAHSAAGVYLYTTFFTSIWLWLFVLGRILLFIATKSDQILSIVKRAIDVDAKPITAIGIVVVVLETAMLWAYGILS